MKNGAKRIERPPIQSIMQCKTIMQDKKIPSLGDKFSYSNIEF